MRDYWSLRLYAVMAAFIAVVAMVGVFASLEGDTVAYGPWMSDGLRSDEGGRNPETYCPDRPWLTGDPNVVDDISESTCLFRRNWTCREQERGDEPVGELCMWSDCTACAGCNHLDSDSQHHWDDCCSMSCTTGADGNETCVCEGGFCIWSDHRHFTPDLDYCASCLDWRWRVEGRPSYSTYGDQLGRLMTFDEYIKAGVETTLHRDLPEVDAINFSLFLAGVPHYEIPVRERSPYYLAPSVLLNGESYLPTHTEWVAFPRSSTGDLYASDPRDRGIYPDLFGPLGDGCVSVPVNDPSLGPADDGVACVDGVPSHLEVLVDPVNSFRYGHIINSTVYQFDPFCPWLDPSVANDVPNLSCPSVDQYLIEFSGAEMREFIRRGIGGILGRGDPVTERALTWEVSFLMGLTPTNDFSDQINVRHDVSKLQHDFIGPGFQILHDRFFAGPVARPAGTPAWIYSWPTATPGPTPRLAGSQDDGLPGDNTIIDRSKFVTGLRVLTSGGELCQVHSKALVLEWNYLSGAFFYEVEVWNRDTGIKVKTEKTYTTRAYVNYLELSPCDGTNPVSYELVVKAYDYTGIRDASSGKHQSGNKSSYEGGGAHAIHHTMPTAPAAESLIDQTPCECPP